MANEEQRDASGEEQITPTTVSDTPTENSRQETLHSIVRNAIIMLLGVSLALVAFYLLRTLGY
jgi:hypothetical protein